MTQLLVKTFNQKKLHTKACDLSSSQYQHCITYTIKIKQSGKKFVKKIKKKPKCDKVNRLIPLPKLGEPTGSSREPL